MKISLNSAALYFTAVLITGSLLFQSCTPSNDIQPVISSPNIVTVKVTDKDQSPSTSNGQSTVIVKQPTRHFQVFTTDQTKKMLLDTNITGSFTYSFKTTATALNISATLTSDSLFLYDMEIDVNNQMHSYHGGSCPVTDYTIKDYISF